MNARLETWLWIAQRASAAVLAVAVTVHLATIVLAVRGGLDAAEVLGRLRGNDAWLAFYLVFVAAVAVHAPLGLRNLLRELTALRGPALAVPLAAFAALLVAAGAGAVLSLYAGGTP